MMNNNHQFVWSDGWYIEGDRAWFIGGREGILFCLDLETKKCEYVAEIPEKIRAFRIISRCIKCENNIFCMPDRGNSIWVYDLICRNFKEINIYNPENVRIEIAGMWKFENRIFAVSYGMGQMIEIDSEQKVIVSYHMLGGSEELVTYTIRINNGIYSLYGSGKVYIFDMETKETVMYKLPYINRRFHSLCMVGNKFWLSGYCKELYLWDKENNSISIKGGFPYEFGIYDYSRDTVGKIDCKTAKYETPAFSYSIVVGGRVWFIPNQTNQILYMDQDSDKLYTFKIKEENETRQSLLENEYGAKYLLEYVIDERYIGLFSLKNKKILEIDTRQLEYSWKKYYFSQRCLTKCAEIYKNVFCDRFSFERELYGNRIRLSNYDDNINKDSVGMKIHQKMKISDM